MKMGCNSDDGIKYDAIKNLYEQAVQKFPHEFSGILSQQFYEEVVYGCNRIGSKSNFRVKQIEEGPNKGKLTLEQRANEWEWKTAEGITPADCYNLIKPGESLAEAVNRLY